MKIFNYNSYLPAIKQLPETIRTSVYHKSDKGFTLIELLIYMALLGIVIGGAIAGVYSLFESQMRNQTHAMIIEEGNFILGKIDWAMTGATSIDTTNPNQILINRSGIPATDNPLIFQLTGGNFYLYRNAYSASVPPLNNANITVTNLVVVHATSTSDGIVPESLKVTFTANAKTPDGHNYAEDFYTLKYLRK